jgi:hypothetical protein
MIIAMSIYNWKELLKYRSKTEEDRFMVAALIEITEKVIPPWDKDNGGVGHKVKHNILRNYSMMEYLKEWKVKERKKTNGKIWFNIEACIVYGSQ